MIEWWRVITDGIVGNPFPINFGRNERIEKKRIECWRGLKYGIGGNPLNSGRNENQNRKEDDRMVKRYERWNSRLPIYFLDEMKKENRAEGVKIQDRVK